jgi:predicted Kef-type K+ transport protein
VVEPDWRRLAFSFIVPEAGQALGLLTDEAFQVVVAVSLLSITLNPGLFAFALGRSRSHQVV